MKKSRKRIVSAIAAVTLLLSGMGFTGAGSNIAFLPQTAITASAVIVYPSISSSKPFKAYTIATSNTRTYSDGNLNNPTGWIYNSDEIWITTVAKNKKGQYVAYGSYPTSRGRKSAWFLYSAVSVANPYPTEKKTAVTSMTTYRRPSGTKAGSVAKDDTVYKLGTKGSWTNILYNIGSASNPSGWRYAWITNSDYSKLVTVVSKSYTGWVKTNGANLALRSASNTSSSVFTWMPNGGQLTVLDNKTKYNGFYKVTYNGKTGYASASYITFTKPTLKGIVTAEPAVYLQTDSRWKNVPYGYSNYAGTTRAYLGKGGDGNLGAGCGILSYVNAVYYLNGKFIDPSTLAAWSVRNGYRQNGVGTKGGLYRAFANSQGSNYGFKFTREINNDYNTLASYIKYSNYVAVGSAPGHLMAVVDYNTSTGKFLILDSAPSGNRGTLNKHYVWKSAQECRNQYKFNFSAFYIIQKR